MSFEDLHLYEPGADAAEAISLEESQPAAAVHPEGWDPHGSDFGEQPAEKATMVRQLLLDLDGSAQQVAAEVQRSLQALGVSGLKRAEVTVSIGPSLGIEIESSNYYSVQVVMHHVQQLLAGRINLMEYISPDSGAKGDEEHLAA